jgi:aquaporin Z
MEAAGLGAFMVSACVFGTLLQHPGSPVRQAIDDALVRRGLMGLAMGATAIGIIHSPWGQQSGAHINPSTTLTFFRLGKIEGHDALLYVLAQCAGGVLGVMVSWIALGSRLGDPAVNYVATLPGPGGPGKAFLAEAAISFGLMLVVLVASNTPRVARFTGLFVGALVAAYITFEAPISGMSMNPARSLASALPAGAWDVLWLYVVAPPAGMVLAAEVYVRRRGAAAVYCAKLDHDNPRPCIFRCRHAELMAPAAPATRGAPEVTRPDFTGARTP